MGDRCGVWKLFRQDKRVEMDGGGVGQEVDVVTGNVEVPSG